MRLSVTTAQAQGHRDEQEDRFLALPDRGLFAVADGLGGHPDGAAAAQAAVDAARGAVGGAAAAALGRLFVGAARAVSALARPCQVTKTMQHKMSCYCLDPATTLTVLWLAEGRAFIGHIGDTVLYRVRGGCAERLTKDHGGRFGLVRCLGSRMAAAVFAADVGADFAETDARPGDLFLLLSDGVPLGPEALASRAAGPFETLAADLVTLGAEAYAARTPRTDNGTCVAVRVDGESVDRERR